MRRHRRLSIAGALAALVLTLGSVARSAVAQPSGPLRSGQVLAADSFSGSELTVYDITGGQRREFARLKAGGWIGPLAVSPDRRLFAVTNSDNGSLWDITSGGDLTGAEPLARNLFPDGVGYLEGLAFDADGNAYVANSEMSEPQPIARVAPTGEVSYLPALLLNPRGLAVQNGTLYVGEGGEGQITAIDLGTGSARVFARGFQRASSHVSAQMVVDPQGRLLLLWATNGDHGLFDITDGGDFTGRAPLVAVNFRIDVNQIAVDSANNVYVAGDGDGIVHISRFDGARFAPFDVYAEDLGDTESVVVVP